MLKQRYKYKRGLSDEIRRVFVYTDELTDKEVVVKFYRLSEPWEREIKYLKMFRNSKYVVKILDYFKEEDKYVIILKLYDYDLWDYLSRKKYMSLYAATKISLNLIDCVKFLHAHSIIHRDIKTENFVYDKENKSWRILDFESATEFESNDRHRTVGTIDYCPPEILQKCTPTPKNDIWMIGCLLFEIYTGKLPFVRDNMSNEEKEKMIIDHKFCHENNEVPMAVREALHELLRYKPNDRPNIWETYELFSKFKRRDDKQESSDKRSGSPVLSQNQEI